MRRSAQKLMVLLVVVSFLFTVFTGCAAIQYEMNAIGANHNDGKAYFSKYTLSEFDYIIGYEDTEDTEDTVGTSTKVVQKTTEETKKVEDLFGLFSEFHKQNLSGKLSNSVIQKHIVEQFDSVLAKALGYMLKKGQKVVHSWEDEGSGGELTVSWLGGKCVSFKLKLSEEKSGFQYSTPAIQYAERYDVGWYSLTDSSSYWKCGVR